MSSTNRTIDLADWRKKRTKTFTTRDGLELTLRASVTVMDMIAQGIIPAPMLASIMALRDGGDPAAMIGKLDEILPSVNAVVCAAVARPRVISTEAAAALVDRLHRAYPDGTPRDAVATALDDFASGEDVGEISSVPDRLAVAREYASAILVSELDFNDRFDIFTVMTGFGEGQASAAAAFPGAA